MTAHEYTEQSEKGDGGEVDSAVTEIVYADTDEGCDPATEENSFGCTADRAGCGAAEKAGGEEPVGTARIETPGFIPAPELIGTVDIGDILLTETASRGDRAGDRGGDEPLICTIANFLDPLGIGSAALIDGANLLGIGFTRISILRSEGEDCAI